MTAKLPTDENTPDMGSSFLLDTFDFADEMNEGVLDGAAQPEAYGLSGLPDGVVTSEGHEDLDVPDFLQDTEEGMDLGELGMLASVSGLPQDEDSEDRAHQDNVSNVVDFSWLEDTHQDPGRLPNLNTTTVIPELVEAWGTRTDGIERVPMQEHSASVEPKKASNADLRRVLARAMRRSAYGDNMDEIKVEIVRDLGHEAKRVAKAVKAMEAEHGLVGNVYIRATAFPGIDQAKWAKHVKAKCPNARYLIACGSCDACKGGCPKDCACNRSLGLKAVASVPWDKAYDHYAPQLEITGRLDRMATVMDKRLSLRQAFLSPTRDTSAKIYDERPIHKTPVERVTMAEAKAEFAAAQPEAREVVRQAERAHAAKVKKVQAKLGQWVKASLLSADEAKKLLTASAKQPEAVLKAASRVITARKKQASYQGDGKHYDPRVSAKAAFAELREAAQAPEDPAFPKLAGETLHEAQKMIRYARQAMSEGFMGKDLKDLLAGRFSKKLRKAAKEQLVQIRKQHEGLSGVAYVDTAAYASKTGATGCEQGAAKHRANAIPTALEMDRCASCVYRNQDNRCQKYNKPLVASAPVKDEKKYQAEQIRLADAPDQEVTASMFSPSEFDLTNNNLEDFSIQDAPALDDLAEYTFGGTIMHDEG